MSEWTNVAAASEIGPGEHRVVDIDDVAIAVFNLDGAYFAIEDVCTHDFGTLTGGCVEGGEIMCPRHGARFDIRTGEALTLRPTSRSLRSRCASTTASSRFAKTEGY